MKIMIDAGHGPDTPGKRSPDGRLREFYFNSAVAEEVKKRLVLDGHNVFFSHQSDLDVLLHERTALANRLKVDLFVSIHANAMGNTFNTASGLETYTYNRPQTATKELAALVQHSLVQVTGRKDRGVKHGDFAVLRNTHMPAILVECGFMTHKQEVELLKSTAYRKRCALGICFGIACFDASR
ncbi:cell wall hydrolase/autolysin [Planococcus antarcticus DSM 14505]|uniref:Cell wall hydrolase/autolysin n=1 Tax=Planococcus antarcticus DSM 14505 TaxID=1185653 RepID=A0A1C7DJC7_9BACL|nr:N-acetylmuramoyl-L-alanine amidase [Planococcus antarcticus]ANU11606.1 N-acetylmuramoyl-L-alanine amidase [Planococcus antarcticus DSM 14505]EIM08088.1 cell wall hydrolase/autolysin [Planococcus antarcticus DSM 14505]